MQKIKTHDRNGKFKVGLIYFIRKSSIRDRYGDRYGHRPYQWSSSRPIQDFLILFPNLFLFPFLMRLLANINCDPDAFNPSYLPPSVFFPIIHSNSNLSDEIHGTGHWQASWTHAARHDDEEESPREDGDHAPRGPSPRWRASSMTLMMVTMRLKTMMTLTMLIMDGMIHEAYVKEDEARRHHGEGRVEAVKFFSTSGRTNMKRSPGNSNTMTGTFEETTSHTKKSRRSLSSPL